MLKDRKSVKVLHKKLFLQIYYNLNKPCRNINFILFCFIFVLLHTSYEREKRPSQNLKKFNSHLTQLN